MRLRFIVLLLLLFAASIATAQVVVSVVPAFAIDYWRFSTPGGAATFDIWARGFAGGPHGHGNLDSWIRINVDDGSPLGALTGALVVENDDDFLINGAGDGSTSGLDSWLGPVLAPGNYIIAVGAFLMTDGEFRSNIATSPPQWEDYQLTYTGVNPLQHMGGGARINGPTPAQFFLVQDLGNGRFGWEYHDLGRWPWLLYQGTTTNVQMLPFNPGQGGILRDSGPMMNAATGRQTRGDLRATVRPNRGAVRFYPGFPHPARRATGFQGDVTFF